MAYTKVTKKVIKSLVDDGAAEDVSNYSDGDMFKLKYNEGGLTPVLVSSSEYVCGYTGVIALGLNSKRLYYFDNDAAMKWIG